MLGELGGRLGQVGRCETGLVRIAVDVHLEQDREASPGPKFLGQAGESSAELDRIDGLDGLEDLDCPAGLVRRERPDEMPAGAGYVGDLPAPLLDPVLTKRVEARRGGIAE